MAPNLLGITINELFNFYNDDMRETGAHGEKHRQHRLI